MLKLSKSHKQIIVYIFILLIGIEIGILFSSYRHAQTSQTSISSTNAEDACRNPAAVTVEPQEEILGAPVFKDSGTLRSTVNGWIHVRWKEVKGAKEYNVRVWNGAGVEVKNFDTLRSFSFLKKLEVDLRLKETPYTIVVTPIGEGKVRGKESPKKMAVMTPLRNLEPPTIKSIHTEAEGDPLPESPKPDVPNTTGG